MLVDTKLFVNKQCFILKMEGKKPKKESKHFKKTKQKYKDIKEELGEFVNYAKNIPSVINNKIKDALAFFNTLVPGSYTIFFLRDHGFYNKGRYSRNRQTYRTGVYWCLYINVVAVIGLNYLFYKFTINFLQY
jgi:hypothetical protein